MVQHPADGGPGVRLEPAGQGGVPGPLGVRPEQHQEQRGGVHRAVVPAVRHLTEVGQLAVAHLVHDLAGLRHRLPAAPGGLRRREREQRGGRRLRPVGQREQRGEQRVAAQQRQEPGRARRRHPQLLAVRAGGRDLERSQVREPARTGRRQLRPVRRERHALDEPPLGGALSPGERGGGPRHAQRPLLAVRPGHHPQHQLRGAVRVRLQRPHEAAGAGAGLLHGVRGGLGGHRRPGQPRAAPVGELHAVVEDFAGADGAPLV